MMNIGRGDSNVEVDGSRTRGCMGFIYLGKSCVACGDLRLARFLSAVSTYAPSPVLVSSPIA